MSVYVKYISQDLDIQLEIPFCGAQFEDCAMKGDNILWGTFWQMVKICVLDFINGTVDG